MNRTQEPRPPRRKCEDNQNRRGLTQELHPLASERNGNEPGRHLPEDPCTHQAVPGHRTKTAREPEGCDRLVLLLFFLFLLAPDDAGGCSSNSRMSASSCILACWRGVSGLGRPTRSRNSRFCSCRLCRLLSSSRFLFFASSSFISASSSGALYEEGESGRVDGLIRRSCQNGERGRASPAERRRLRSLRCGPGSGGARRPACVSSSTSSP